MTDHWVTIASPTTLAMLNPLLSACKEGFVPDDITAVSNPTITDEAATLEPIYRRILEAHGTGGEVTVREVSDETAFDEIATLYGELIDVPAGDAVAIDITPGRKFMSAIAFQAGLSHGADHVFYLHLASDAHYNRLYPNIPQTAVDLVDFTEVI